MTAQLADGSAKEIVRLLQAKNRCLQRVLELCGKFLAEWDCEGLPIFQHNREVLFKGLELCDRRLSDNLSNLPDSSRTPWFIGQTRIALSAKDQFVQALIRIDNEIMARLETEKGRLQDEIAGNRRGQSLVNKFKSSWVPESGEGLDQRL